MDGRKNNGGWRPGSGRRPKADEIKIIETMDAIAAPEKVWKKLYELVVNGDGAAIKTWLEYRYGKPKVQADINLGILSIDFTE